MRSPLCRYSPINMEDTPIKMEEGEEEEEVKEEEGGEATIRGQVIQTFVSNMVTWWKTKWKAVVTLRRTCWEEEDSCLPPWSATLAPSPWALLSCDMAF